MASKGSSGFKNGMISIITLFILAGGILGWANVNHVRSFNDAYDYFHYLSNKAKACTEKENNPYCAKLKEPKSSNQIHLPNPNATNRITIPKGTKIDTNVNIKPPVISDSKINTKPILPNANLATTTAALNNINIIKSEQKVDYKRSDWKHWVGEPCNTRKIVLINQGTNVKVNKTSTSCKIISGEWLSPYDGEKTKDSSKFDIDHVIPLAYAATHGGQSWSAAKKQQFANDTTQLYAVSANSNRSKSDKGPAEYMPQDSFKCEYSKTWVATLNKYGVAITAADKAALTKGLALCKN